MKGTKLKIQNILYLLILIIFTSCGNNYLLNDNDKKWNPYKGNEVLVFESNKGQIDSIHLRGAYIEKNVLSPYAIFPDSIEILKVYCNNYDPNSNFLCGDDEFIEIRPASPADGDYSSFFFVLTMKNAIIEGQFHFIENLDTINVTSLDINNRKYNDIAIIKGIYEDNIFEWEKPNNQIIYWSKTDGIVMFDLGDGNIWKLKNKYAP